MKKIIKKLLFGATLPQEYLCLNLNDFNRPLRLLIQNSNQDFKDITQHHLFNGYKPLVISMDGNNIDEDVLDKIKSILVSFIDDKNKELANLKLKLRKKINIESSSLLIFEGINGKHQFNNNLHKIISDLKYRLTVEKKDNVYLPGNLYDQIKIGYSVPRKIYLVSVGSGSLFNIFPTDLSGTIDNKTFVLSLRTGGKANEQIETEGKCVVSEMSADSFEAVYKAGKNHMKDKMDLIQFNIKFREERSAGLNIPVPLDANKYFELEKVSTLKLGIHTLHIMKILNSVKLTESNSVLAHIHRDFAEWRIRNGIETNYFIRRSN